jgi:hypothetical protein
MAPLPLVLMVFAFVLFALATTPAGKDQWNRLTSAGLACWSLAVLLGYTGLLTR